MLLIQAESEKRTFRSFKRESSELNGYTKFYSGLYEMIQSAHLLVKIIGGIYENTFTYRESL